jgi:hypothetical protein
MDRQTQLRGEILWLDRHVQLYKLISSSSTAATTSTVTDIIWPFPALENNLDQVPESWRLQLLRP